MTKGGKQNITNEFSYLSNQELKEQKAIAKRNGETDTLKKIQREEKRRGIRNKQKR